MLMNRLIVLLSAAAAVCGEGQVSMTGSGGDAPRVLQEMPAGDATRPGIPDKLRAPGVSMWEIPRGERGSLDLRCRGTTQGSQRGAEALTCETAFARGVTHQCFLDIPLENNRRWGWTNVVSGDTRMPVFAAASQCNPENGFYAADLVVTYHASGVTVVFEPLAGVELSEIHVYVGREILPRRRGEFTVDPEAYPVVRSIGVSAHPRVEFVGLAGSLYVVAQAVVCSTPFHIPPLPADPPIPSGCTACVFYVMAVPLEEALVEFEDWSGRLLRSGWAAEEPHRDATVFRKVVDGGVPGVPALPALAFGAVFKESSCVPPPAPCGTFLGCGECFPTKAEAEACTCPYGTFPGCDECWRTAGDAFGCTDADISCPACPPQEHLEHLPHPTHPKVVHSCPSSSPHYGCGKCWKNRAQASKGGCS